MCQLTSAGLQDVPGRNSFSISSDNLESVILELSEKYGAEYDLEMVIDCVERAIMSSVLIVYGKTAFVLWEGTTPRVYVATERGIKEIKAFNNQFFRLLVQLFQVFLKRKVQLERLMASSRIPGETTAGTVKDVMPDGTVLVDIDGIQGIVRKNDQIKKERGKYFEGAKLFFYIKKTTDMQDGGLGLALSRTSGNLVTGLIKLLSADIIKSFYNIHKRMPVLFCYRRIAGFRADVYSEILIPRDILKKVRLLVNDGYLAVKPFSIG